MSFDPERSPQAAQQKVPELRLYEPIPVSLNDEMTLPDSYPAFYDDQTLRIDSPQVDSNGSRSQMSVFQPRVSPPVYRPRPFLPWLLLVAGALGGILLLSGAGFVALNAEGIHPWTIAPQHGIALPIQNMQAQNASPADLASDYYNAIERQDYVKAYSYLHLNALPSHWDQDQPATQDATQDAYMQQANAADSDDGYVTHYSIYHTEMIDNNYARVILGIRRADDYYRVALDVRMIDGTWRIVQFSSI
jgi:hypothetical protein